MNIYLYILIVVTGILSIYTDILQKKIKNSHLFIICVGAGILYSIYFFVGKLKIPFFHFIINPFICLSIGYILFKSGMWKGGDAKLFLTYSLLLPANKYSPILPFSCMVLFFNTFLISFIFVLPLCIKDILNTKKPMVNIFISKKELIDFIKIYATIIGTSWILFFLVNFFPMKRNIFLEFILIYIGYSIINKLSTTVKNKTIMATLLMVGLIARYIPKLNVSSLMKLINYLKSSFVYSFIFYIFMKKLKPENPNSERVPLAPFMFLGALLTNTEFLWWVIKILNSIWRRA